MRTFILTSALTLAALSATGHAQEAYTAFTGPMGEEWSRMGTDGVDLYFTTNANELHRYSFSTSDPAGGTWTQLASAPKNIDAWDSYRGLAHQGGYLYCTAETAPWGRTILRYVIATDLWEEWGGANSCNSSGNALFMHPTQAGVGISAWHAGFNWVSFDWNNNLANNAWMNMAGLLNVQDDDWISRNEEAVPFGDGFNYYAVKNDRTHDVSAGDVVYSFDLNGGAGMINLVAVKPFQSGVGSSLEMVHAADPLNTTGNDELWFYRGGDGLQSSMEGWSLAATTDLGILDLTATTWATYTTPFYQGNGTDSVMIGDLIFVKSCGDDTSPTAYDDQFWVTFGTGHPGIQYCPGDGVTPHTICPCANNNNGDMGGCDWGNVAFPEGGVLIGTGSDSIAAGDTFLVATGVENNFGIFFGAANQVNSGNGNPLNDGLRCAGGALVRLIPPTAASGNAMTLPSPLQTLDIGAASGVTRRYQYWFRTPVGPCGQMANLTNGYEIAWLP